MMDMFQLEVGSEEILCKIKASMPVETKHAAKNFFQNLLFTGGDIANMITLVLTRDKFILQYRGHCAIGWGEETRRIDEFQLADIDYFKVEKVGKEERIMFKIKQKEYLFIRENGKGDDLGTVFSQELNHIRLGYF